MRIGSVKIRARRHLAHGIAPPRRTRALRSAARPAPSRFRSGAYHRTERGYWWYDHLGDMIGAGIAAPGVPARRALRLVSVFSFGDLGTLAWFAPVVVSSRRTGSRITAG